MENYNKELEKQFIELKKQKEEADRNLLSAINKEYRDEKAVKNAINRIHNGEYNIVRKEESDEVVSEETAEAEAEAAE